MLKSFRKGFSAIPKKFKEILDHFFENSNEPLARGYRSRTLVIEIGKKGGLV